MGLVDKKGILFNKMQDYKKSVFQLSDNMWEHPELGLEEYAASGAMKQILGENGFRIEDNIGGLPTAFIASYGNTSPVFGINVEYDCLPGMSQKKDEYRPVPVADGAPGQGCGHNILGPAAILAGLSLKNAIQDGDIKGTIKLFGSPYEESSVGKPVMGKAGVYENVDFFLDWHPMNYNRADYDECNSVFISEYAFYGKACHGAYPWEGRSALDSALLFSHAVEMLREHIIPNGPDAAHTINYTFSDTGPEFANIVPDKASVILYGRFNDLEIAKDVYRRVKLCAMGAAMATETKSSDRLITFTHPKLPNKTLAGIVHRNMEEIGVPEYTEEEQNFVKAMQHESGLKEDGLETGIEPFRHRESIITDASEYSWNAPYATFELAMGPKGGWHNWMVTACAGSSIGKKTLECAAKILIGSAVDIVTNETVLYEAKAEFAKRMEGKTYKSLLPDDYIPPLGCNAAAMHKYFPYRTNKF